MSHAGGSADIPQNAELGQDFGRWVLMLCLSKQELLLLLYHQDLVDRCLVAVLVVPATVPVDSVPPHKVDHVHV